MPSVRNWSRHWRSEPQERGGCGSHRVQPEAAPPEQAVAREALQQGSSGHGNAGANPTSQRATESSSSRSAGNRAGCSGDCRRTHFSAGAHRAEQYYAYHAYQRRLRLRAFGPHRRRRGLPVSPGRIHRDVLRPRGRARHDGGRADLGCSTTTPEVGELIRLRDEAREQVASFRSAGDPNGAMGAAMKSQFFSEALRSRSNRRTKMPPNTGAARRQSART